MNMQTSIAGSTHKVDGAKKVVSEHVHELANLTDFQRKKVLNQALGYVVTHSGDIEIVNGVCVRPHLENIANYVRSIHKS